MKKMDGETSQQYDNEVKSSFDKSTIIPGSETTSGITIGNEQNSLTQYWHRRTIILLFLGIMASYCCVFTVGMTSPLIMKDLNLNESQLAYILTVARSVRIFPKLFSGLIVDIFGGRNMFLLSHLLTCLFTLLFSYGHSVNYLALMWTGNNISTTLAWPALVKVSSKWFSYKILGNVMSILSLSYLFGDAIAKLYLSGFIYYGVGWRTLFHVAFLTLFTFVLIGQWGLRASPKDVGLVEPEVDPSNVFGSAGNSDEFMGFRKSLAPLVFNLPFWLLVLQSGGLNMMIYVCNDWLSLYLKQRCQATDFVSVLSTILFPVAGGFSALLIGQLFDRFSIRGRNIMMILFHVGTCLVTVLMYLANLDQAPASQFTTMLLFTLLGLTVTGPYTLPSGVLAIKFGGKKIAATMVGIIDAVGTVASLLSAILGSTFLDKHNLPVEERWGNIFLAMFLDALFVMTLSVAYLLVDRPETNKEKK